MGIVKLAALAALSQAQSGDWTDKVDEVLGAVVSIDIATPRAFDDTGAGSSHATGFVVDAERGLILTNRHVSRLGPAVHRATFHNDEEVDLKVVYRDPVHDYALLQYDPDELRFARPPALPLEVDGAEVGDTIWAVGNDSGEKVVIHKSTLARKDRLPPSYDLDIAYWQAATDVAGGGSGSPVLNQSGRVVALHSGGKSGEQASYHMPLDRIARTLAKVQAGEEVSRGTLQVVWTRVSYGEAHDRGLRAESEAILREAAPDGSGVLMVDKVIPGGPGEGVLRPGDLLTAIDGRPINRFVQLEAVLDSHVSESVTLSYERLGQSHTAALRVDDLFALTPNSYIEFDRNILHPLNYLEAAQVGRKVTGLRISAQGTSVSDSRVPRRGLIATLDGRPVPDLDALEAVLADIPAGRQVVVGYEKWSRPGGLDHDAVAFDATWSLRRRCDESPSGWTCRDLPAAPAHTVTPATVDLPLPQDKVARKVARSLVEVVTWQNAGVVGAMSGRRGTGVVVDADTGLVLVDRSSVPGPFVSAHLIVGGRLEVPAEVVWVHPEHEVAWLRYNPAHVADTPLQSAVLLPERPERGDELTLVWLDPRSGVQSTRSTVTDLRLPTMAVPSPPRFQESGVELLRLADQKGEDGVLVDKKGRVLALWAGFTYDYGKKNQAWHAGLPIEVALATLDGVRSGNPTHPSLGLLLGTLTPVDAAARGVSQQRLGELAKARPQGMLLEVRRLVPGSDAADKLRSGDVLVALNGAPLAWGLDLEAAAARGPVDLVVVRDKTELTVTLAPDELPGAGPDRVVEWAGMMLMEPAREVGRWHGAQPPGLYISRYWYGGPNHIARMRAAALLVEVDGEPVGDLDDLLEVVARLKDRQAVPVLLWDPSRRAHAAHALRLDLVHFPTRSWTLASGHWQVSSPGPLDSPPSNGSD